jgi:hypothetical protein
LIDKSQILIQVESVLALSGSTNLRSLVDFGNSHAA